MFFQLLSRSVQLLCDVVFAVTDPRRITADGLTVNADCDEGFCPGRLLGKNGADPGTDIFIFPLALSGNLIPEEDTVVSHFREKRFTPGAACFRGIILTIVFVALTLIATFTLLVLVPVVVVGFVVLLVPCILDESLTISVGKPFAFKGQADPEFIGVSFVQVNYLNLVLVSNLQFHFCVPFCRTGFGQRNTKEKSLWSEDDRRLQQTEKWA